MAWEPPLSQSLESLKKAVDCAVLLVYFSESLNEIASKNWNLFSRQQYFDGNGMFISLVFCTPILLNCMVLVASWLYQSSQLMAQLKRAQLQNRLQAEEHQKEAALTTNGSSSVRQRRRSSIDSRQLND